MHKTKYRKTSRARPPGAKSDPREGKFKILEKRLSPTAQNHYADLEDTCRDKVTKVGVIVRYNKKVIGKKTKAGVLFDPRWPFEGYETPQSPTHLALQTVEEVSTYVYVT